MSLPDTDAVLVRSALTVRVSVSETLPADTCRPQGTAHRGPSSLPVRRRATTSHPQLVLHPSADVVESLTVSPIRKAHRTTNLLPKKVLI